LPGSFTVEVVYLLLLVAASPLVYGRLLRAPARDPGATQERQDMIRLTLTEPEARMFRVLIVLGSRAVWPGHVEWGRELVARKELDQLTRSVPPEQLLDTASFYWAQLSRWLRDRTPAVESTDDRSHARDR
jgi:hypothetical protein